MSAIDRVTTLGSDRKGEGPCPVCHKDRKVSRCTTAWTTKLEAGSSINRRGWHGHLSVFCEGFLDDREELAERMNVYHERAAPPTTTESE